MTKPKASHMKKEAKVKKESSEEKKAPVLSTLKVAKTKRSTSSARTKNETIESVAESTSIATEKKRR